MSNVLVGQSPSENRSMKRCPECMRDYYDDTLLYCLDDGNALLEGPRSEPGAVATGFPADEPQTAILHSTAASGEAPTRAQIHTTEQTAVLPRGSEAEPREAMGGLSEKQSFSANRAAKPLAAAVAVCSSSCRRILRLSIFRQRRITTDQFHRRDAV